MVDIGDEHPIDLPAGKLRVGGRTENRLYAGHVLISSQALHKLEHLRLDVLTIDGSARLYERCHLTRIVSRPASHISDDDAGSQGHRLQDTLRFLLYRSVRALEPLCAQIGHECRRHPMPVVTADLRLSRIQAGSGGQEKGE